MLVRFPFSDVTQTKLRPAVVLADAGRGDWILCQVTSNPYGDPAAVALEDADLARSYMVGDNLPDMMAGWAAGCATVLVLTGYGLQIQEQADPEVLQRVDHVAVDLAAAAAWTAGRTSA